MKITKNLSRHEIECPCPCNVDTFDFETADVIQKTVDHFQKIYPDMNVGLHINSGNRCKQYNASIGGSAKSKHIEYRAADFYLYDKITKKHISDDDVAYYLEAKYPNKYGIGRYNGRTHFDSRALTARWDKR